MLQEISADLTDCSGVMTEKPTSEQGVGEGMGKVCPLQRACIGRKGVLPARANWEGSPGIACLSAACFLAIRPRRCLGEDWRRDVLYLPR